MSISKKLFDLLSDFSCLCLVVANYSETDRDISRCVLKIANRKEENPFVEWKDI